MNYHLLAAEIVLAQTQCLDHRAHGAVRDDHALGQGSQEGGGGHSAPRVRAPAPSRGIPERAGTADGPGPRIGRDRGSGGGPGGVPSLVGAVAPAVLPAGGVVIAGAPGMPPIWACCIIMAPDCINWVSVVCDSSQDVALRRWRFLATALGFLA